MKSKYSWKKSFNNSKSKNNYDTRCKDMDSLDMAYRTRILKEKSDPHQLQTTERALVKMLVCLYSFRQTILQLLNVYKSVSRE